MNLVIDIGNTLIKAAVFIKNKKIEVFTFSKLSYEIFSRILDKYSITQIIFSSVIPNNKILLQIFSEFQIPLIQLTHQTSIPFKIAYKTPTTLGADRIAGVAFAYNKTPDSNNLIIDAGTAVTYDFLTNKGVYVGGNISPGIAMRFRALHEFTGALPLVNPTAYFDMIGKNTLEAINTGVLQGLVFEINEYIRSFENKHPALKIYISGGDGKFLTENINSMAIFEPDITVIGLNNILNFNA